MSWICVRCNLTLVNLVLVCYCGEKRGEFEPFDSIDRIVNKQRISKLDNLLYAYRTSGVSEIMTHQEEEFKKFFNHEKILVKDMNALELRAHIEELARYAFVARARLSSALDEEDDRAKKKKKAEGPSGFTKSLNTDEVTTDAINAVKRRGEKLSKMDKIKQKLNSIPGMDPEFVQNVMSARNIRDQVSKISLHGKDEKREEKTITIEKKIFNPFQKG